MTAKPFLPLALMAKISLCQLPLLASVASYDLRSVNGIETFGGSAAARELLGRNGFVVADPAFKQIFDPYIRSPQVEVRSTKNPRGTFPEPHWSRLARRRSAGFQPDTVSR